MGSDYIHVNVLEQDILNGIPTNPRCCPIAVAFNRIFPDITDVTVLSKHMYWKYMHIWWCWAMGLEVIANIIQIDRGLCISPFSFVIHRSDVRAMF